MVGTQAPAVQVVPLGHVRDAGFTHCPLPLQVDASVRNLPVHFAGAHGVPLAATSQAPSAVQTPVAPHGEDEDETHTRCGSGEPGATGWQDPIESGRRQEVHWPAHGPSQQTPSAQKPLTHSGPDEHPAASGFSPQLPPVHTAGTWHGAVAPHVDAQRTTEPEVSHVYGAQDSTVAARQVPAPSHTRLGIKSPVPLHRVDAHS